MTNFNPKLRLTTQQVLILNLSTTQYLTVKSLKILRQFFEGLKPYNWESPAIENAYAIAYPCNQVGNYEQDASHNYKEFL